MCLVPPCNLVKTVMITLPPQRVINIFNTNGNGILQLIPILIFLMSDFENLQQVISAISNNIRFQEECTRFGNSW